MPYADIEKRRKYNREGERRRRAKRRAEREAAQATAAAALPNVSHLPDGPPIDRLAAWSQNVLRVPAGHALAGRALTLPDYGRAFLADAVTHREALLCCARKQAKSSIVAVLALGYLVGPLAAPGQRLAIVSVSRPKAGELLTQMEAIATASALPGVRFWRSPSPGRGTSADCTVDVLSADRTAGHASGFDLVIVDETGLLQERDRALLNGLRSSVSARDGRVLHLSIRGDGPFIPELLALRDDPAVSVHLYEAPAGCALDDEAAWAARKSGTGRRHQEHGLHGRPGAHGAVKPERSSGLPGARSEPSGQRDGGAVVHDHGLAARGARRWRGGAGAVRAGGARLRRWRAAPA